MLKVDIPSADLHGFSVWHCPDCQRVHPMGDRRQTLRRVDALFHITHLQNLPSIAEHGLLCHSRARKHCVRDISDAAVQERRIKADPLFSRPLHSYVPTYLQPRNAMLYRCEREHGASALCIIEVDVGAADRDDVLVTDRNAAASSVRYFRGIASLNQLDFAKVFARSWIDDPTCKQHMQAEVLVPEHIPQSRLKSVSVAGSGSAARARELAAGLADLVTVRRSLFFL